VLPLMLRTEAAEADRYRDEAEATDTMAAQEAAAGRTIAAMQGIPTGGRIARSEGRHRAGIGGALRATVFGINDGLVSNFSLVMGVAGGTSTNSFVVLAGVAGLVAGAFSMASGEWISIRSQRELYENELRIEREELRAFPEEEREELGLDPGQLGSPWVAAVSSFLAFALGAAIPVVPFLIGSGTAATIAAAVVSVIALFAAGAATSIFTGRHAGRSGLRMAAIGAAEHVGVAPDIAASALATFENVRRRMELRGEAGGAKVYDDFAHHPTAMHTTIGGLRRKIDHDITAPGAAPQRILAVFEPRSNTMKLGTMNSHLPWALEEADLSFCLQGDYGWDAAAALAPMGTQAVVAGSVDKLVEHVVRAARPGDHVLVMSNGGFGGIHGKLLTALQARR